MKNLNIFQNIKGFVFDLDGTLVDSAPDLAAAVNHVRSLKGLAPMPLDTWRYQSSQGAGALVCLGLEMPNTDEQFDGLRQAFLEYYEANPCVYSQIFPGIQPLLDTLEQKNIPWGIVTNKHQRFTHQVTSALNLDKKASVIVSGDTTEFAKPHPAPLLYAAEKMNLEPKYLAYFGDDERDILAARAAGYGLAIAIGYGYAPAPEVETWHADLIIQTSTTFADLIFQF